MTISRPHRAMSLGVVAIFLGLIFSCNKPTAIKDDESVRIGVIAPFDTAPGEGIRNGARMAVDEINAAGGIDGRRLEIVEANDEYSSEKAVRAYQRLAGQEKVIAVVGMAGDGIFPIMEQLARYRVPILATGTGADSLTELVGERYDRYRWFFRVMHRSSELGAVTVDFAKGCLVARHNIHKFAIMVEDDIWTKAIRDVWQKELNDGTVQVVYSATFDSQTHDFGVLFQKITDSGTEYILDACSRVDATSYLKRWASANAPPIGAIPTGAGTKRYYALLGEQGLFVSSVATIPSEQNPLTPKSAGWSREYLHRLALFAKPIFL